MITTREFFESDADNIILDMETYWTIQRDGTNKYINVPFPSKEDFLERYETGLDDPYDEISDADAVNEEEQKKLIKEQKDRISKAYDVVKAIRDEFDKSFNSRVVSNINY